MQHQAVRRRGSRQAAAVHDVAFGMHRSFQTVHEQADGVLGFARREKEGNGSGLAQGKKDIERIRRLPNVVVAIGHHIEMNSFDHRLEEIDRITPR